MKIPLFISINLLKESFFEINRKDRINIYIYLFYILCLELIVNLSALNLSALGDSLIVLDAVIIFVIIIDILALVSLMLKRISNKFFKWYAGPIIFGLCIQILPFVYILNGTYNCFELITGETLITDIDFYSILTILSAIITLWTLRSILKLRQHALEKNKIN